MWYVCDVLYQGIYIYIYIYIYRFAIVVCLVLLRCSLTNLSSVLCVLMVKGMFVVVNEMWSLMSVMSPLPALCHLSAHMVMKSCTLCVFASIYVDLLYLSLTPSLSHSLSLPISLSIYLAISLSIYIYIYLSLSLCPCGMFRLRL